MRYPFKLVLACGLFLLPNASSFAQDAAKYPPAAGHMTVIPPNFVAPGSVGGNYVETFPAFGGTYQPAAYVAQPVAPSRYTMTPRPRARLQRGARVYSRGYNQAPAPYATQLPQGQLYWPNSSLRRDTRRSRGSRLMGRATCKAPMGRTSGADITRVSRWDIDWPDPPRRRPTEGGVALLPCLGRQHILAERTLLVSGTADALCSRQEFHKPGKGRDRSSRLVA